MNTPNLGLTEFLTGTAERVEQNNNLVLLDAFTGGRVLSANINATSPPVSPANGAIVLVGSPATGAFASRDGNVAINIGDAGSPSWRFIPPSAGLSPVPTTTGFFVPNGTLDGWEAFTVVTGTSPLTTKGDVYVNDGTQDTRLGIGTDGQVLTANSATSEGLAWSDPAGGSGIAGGDARRTDYTAQTASLADGASELVNVTFAQSALLGGISADVPCLVRGYSSIAARAADDGRDAVTPAPEEIEGLIFDTQVLAGNLQEDFNAGTSFVNMETLAVPIIYLKIFNQSGAASVVNVTIQAAPMRVENTAGYEIHTISATLALTNTSAYNQYIDGGLADRDVELPDPPQDGKVLELVNIGATNNLLIKETSAGPTAYTLTPGSYIKLHYTAPNSTWNLKE